MDENLFKELISSRTKANPRLKSLAHYLVDVISTRGELPHSEFEILSWFHSDLSGVAGLLTKIKGLRKKGGEINVGIR